MPFTQAEKAKICRFSGWPWQSLLPDTIFYNSYLNQWALLIEFNDDMFAQARTFIERIDDIDTRLADATKRLSLTGVGQNEVLYNPDEVDMLRSERRRVIREMKKALGVPSYT